MAVCGCLCWSVGLCLSFCRSGGLWWSLVVVRVVLCVCVWSVCGLSVCRAVSGLSVSGAVSGGLCVGLCVGLWCCVFVGLVWWSVCHAVNRAGSKKNYLTRKRRATK